MSQKDLLHSSLTNRQELPNATLVLVLGILSIICSMLAGLGMVFAIAGLILSGKESRRYTASPELYAEASFNKLGAGRICAIIGLVLSAMIILFIVAAILYVTHTVRF